MDILDGISQCWWLSKTCVPDWTAWSAIATALVGVATVKVACLAWRTSRQAANIAASQHNDWVELRNGESRVVGHLLIHEFTALPAKLGSASKRLGLVSLEPNVSKWAERVHGALAGFGAPLLPSAERIEGKIHTLPPKLGTDIAELIGKVCYLQSAVARFLSNVDKAIDFKGKGEGGPYITQVLSEQEEIEREINSVQSLAMNFVPEFRQFVRGGPDDSEQKL